MIAVAHPDTVGRIVTATINGHRVRLVVTAVDGYNVHGTELRSHMTATLAKVRNAGGRFLIATDGRVYVRQHVRTVPANSIVKVHRERDIDS